MKQEQEAYLRLHRFCGEELYPVESATWHYYRNKDGNVNELWLEINAGLGLQLSEDTMSLGGKPHWEVTIRMESLEISDLNVGFRAEIGQGYDENTGDYLTNFYYCEHEPSDNNRIEVIEKQGSRILFRLEGEVTDVNYYDGTKPKNRIFVETWFEEN